MQAGPRSRTPRVQQARARPGKRGTGIASTTSFASMNAAEARRQAVEPLHAVAQALLLPVREVPDWFRGFRTHAVKFRKQISASNPDTAPNSSTASPGSSSLRDLARDERAAEHGERFGGGDEIPTRAELSRAARVVTEAGLVPARTPVAREGNPVSADPVSAAMHRAARGLRRALRVWHGGSGDDQALRAHAAEFTLESAPHGRRTAGESSSGDRRRAAHRRRDRAPAACGRRQRRAAYRGAEPQPRASKPS